MFMFDVFATLLTLLPFLSNTLNFAHDISKSSEKLKTRIHTHTSSMSPLPSQNISNYMAQKARSSLEKSSMASPKVSREEYTIYEPQVRI